MGESSPPGEELCAQEGQLSDSGWGGSGASKQVWKFSSPQDRRVVLQVWSCPRPTEQETLGRAQRSVFIRQSRGFGYTLKSENLQVGRKLLHLLRFSRRAAIPGDKGVETLPVWGGPPSQILKGRAKTRTPGFGFLLQNTLAFNPATGTQRPCAPDSSPKGCPRALLLALP